MKELRVHAKNQGYDDAWRAIVVPWARGVGLHELCTERVDVPMHLTCLRPGPSASFTMGPTSCSGNLGPGSDQAPSGNARGSGDAPSAATPPAPAPAEPDADSLSVRPVAPAAVPLHQPASDINPFGATPAELKLEDLISAKPLAESLAIRRLL